MTTVLHVSPHADDEMLGCPATLLALRDSGARVVNLLLNLSAAETRERRTSEAETAHARSGLELRVLDPSPLPPGGAREDPAAAEAHVVETLASLVKEIQPDLVVGPQPYDVHEAHELTGRAIRDVLSREPGSHRWWMWGVWGELALPTLMTPYGEERFTEITGVLSAYEKEIERNDYVSMVRGRGLVAVAAGSERIFGFGVPRATSEPYADVLTEVWHDDAGWSLGAATMFEVGDLPELSVVCRVDEWLHDSPVGHHIAAWRSQQGRELFG